MHFQGEETPRQYSCSDWRYDPAWIRLITALPDGRRTVLIPVKSVEHLTVDEQTADLR